MTASIFENNSLTRSDVPEIESGPEMAASHPAAGSTRFVSFFFGDDLYCIAADEVAEVTHPIPVSTLPHGPQFLSGVAPHRGEIVAVIDVGRMLGRNAGASSTRSKCVVLRKSENESQPSFMVDRMHELMTFENGVLSVDSQAEPIVLGNAKVGAHTIKLLNPVAIRAALNS